MMGFSAGGWLAEHVAFKYYQENCEWYPDFVALVYYGSHEKRIKKIKDPKNLPPFFMAIARDDYRLGVRRVMPYLSRVALDVPQSELHVYRDGEHGFGLAYDETRSVSAWKYAFLNWVECLK